MKWQGRMSNDLLAQTITAYRLRIIETQDVLERCRRDLAALEAEAECRRLKKPVQSTLTFADWRKANPGKHMVSFIREQAAENFDLEGH